MAVSADALRAHVDYTAWASQRLLDAASQLTPEELTRDFKTSDKNVLDTLVHTFAADRIWLRRIEGDPSNIFIDPEDRDLARLRQAWPALHRQWRAWAARLTDQQAVAEISYRDRAANAYRQPLWQIVLHVVNHGTHHRGMVSGFIRAMGHTPPGLDLIAFYRTSAASGASEPRA
ncbi:MAG: DinB family protein [Acidobacteriia bacterium]|nr:DinB family protein [Terriglobia bacterium]